MIDANGFDEKTLEEQIAQWMAEAPDEPTRKRIEKYGRAVYVMDPDEETDSAE